VQPGQGKFEEPSISGHPGLNLAQKHLKVSANSLNNA
jgi:G2/mitotic-specific cyclin-B, other